MDGFHVDGNVFYRVPLHNLSTLQKRLPRNPIPDDTL
jgi:hypothetical protein